MLPLPLPDDKGRSVVLGRNGAFPPDVKIVDLIKANFMMADILLEEDDRMVICGSVNVTDNENSSLAQLAQMTPAIAKKMSTYFQVTFAEPQLANNFIFVVPCIMLNSEIIPTRCNNCVYSSQWLYSTCFG